MPLATRVRLAALFALATGFAAGPLHAQTGARRDGVHHTVYSRDNPPPATEALVRADLRAAATVTTFDSGGGVEADNITAVAVSGDGALIVATHAYTDNLTVIDAQTRAVLANVPVGSFPIGVAATDRVAVVANLLAHTVSVVDLATRTVRATIPVPGSPVRVVVSPDGRTAFVALEAAGGAGTCQIVDLATDAVVGAISGFPMRMIGRTTSDYFDRVEYEYLPFVVTPDGQRLLLASVDARLLVYDVASRSLVGAVPLPLAPLFATGLDVAADGSAAVFSSLLFSPSGVGRVDLASLTVTAFVPVTTSLQTFSSSVATTADASRAIVARSGAAGAQAAIVRFDGTPTRFVPILPSDALVRSADRRTVLFGGRGLTLLDVEAESVVWSEAANAHRVMLAASLTEPLFAAGSVYGRENVQVIDAGAGGPQSTAVETGEPPEGDGPSRMLPLPDGRVLVTNTLSGTLAVVDAAAARTDATWALGASLAAAAVTADGTRAVAVGDGFVRLVDLGTGATLASATLPDSFYDLAIMPDGSLVVASSYGADAPGVFGTPRVVVLRRDGAAYAVVRTFAGYAQGLAAAPDGSAFIVALDPFPAAAAVVFLDGGTGEEIARRLSGAAVTAVDVSSDGRFAVAVESAAGRLTAFELAPGSVSAGTSFGVPAPAGNAAFVPGAAEVWVAAAGALRRHSALTGVLVESRPVTGQASLVRVAPNGEPVALLDGFSAAPRLWARGAETALPELVSRLVGDNAPPDLLPTPFALAAGGNVALLGGVRDRLVAVQALGVAAEAGAGASALAVAVSPNPTAGASSVTVDVPTGGAEARVEVFNVTGRLVRTLHAGPLAAGRQTVAWDGRDGSGRPAASGVYAVRVSTDGAVRIVRLAVVR